MKIVINYMRNLRQSNQEKCRNALGVFSVIWIIVTSGGVFFNSRAIVNITLILDVFLLMAQIALMHKFILKRHATPFGYLVLMITCVLFSIILNLDFSAWLSYARLFLILTLAFGTSLLIDNDRIVQVFVKVVIALAVASVILFYSEFVARNASLFPVIDFYDYKYINALIYLHFESVESRNFGIFIEPGMYQIYLNLCLFALLYGRQNIKYKYKYIFVAILLLAIFSTNSTTGYILGVIIIGFLAFKKSQKKQSMFRLTARAVLVILAVSLVGTSQFFITNIQDKFNADKQLSFITRQNSTLIDLLIVAKNPLTGGGMGNYQDSLDKYDATGLTIDAATNTFSQLAAIVGLPFVLLIVSRVILTLVRVRTDPATKIVFFILYIVCFSTEPFILYPLFYLLMFMSFKVDISKAARI